MCVSLFLRRRTGSALALFLVALLGAPPAGATTVAKMSFSEVVTGAEVIAVGTVSAIEQTWDAELEIPFTLVTFSDLEVLKGAVGGEDLTLRFLGGPAPDGLTLVVAGMPQFAVRDRAVVFSTGNGVQACPLVGWWQGLYRLLYDASRDTFTVADHLGRNVARFDGGLGQRVTRLSSAPEVAAGLEAAEPEALTARRVQDPDSDRSAVTTTAPPCSTRGERRSTHRGRWPWSPKESSRCPASVSSPTRPRRSA